jgi:hypothetical protein
MRAESGQLFADGAAAVPGGAVCLSLGAQLSGESVAIAPGHHPSNKTPNLLPERVPHPAQPTLLLHPHRRQHLARAAAPKRGPRHALAHPAATDRAKAAAIQGCHFEVVTAPAESRHRKPVVPDLPAATDAAGIDDGLQAYVP